MNKPQPRLGLNLRVAQKQILTPGLVQMVTVLALNKLELREMINQEMVENPVLEEVAEGVPALEDVQKKTESEAPPEAADAQVTSADDRKDPFSEVDYGSFFNDYLDPGYKSPAAEDVERPSFENFITRPTSLSEHLSWQVNLSSCPERVQDAAYSIIGNLNEDGYLTATLEELAQGDGYDLKTVEEALALVQELDPAGVGARDLRECLLIQLRLAGAGDSLATSIVAHHLAEVETKQLKKIASALNCPLEEVEAGMEIIRHLDPKPGQRYNNVEPRLIEPDVAFVKMGEEYRVVMNEEGLP
ncbi:MAG: RNA polymerase factor sigma-54, partial [Terriglobia bacterium]